eukprot:PhM_4_TR3399/c0_g1_i2/m.78361
MVQFRSPTLPIHHEAVRILRELDSMTSTFTELYCPLTEMIKDTMDVAQFWDPSVVVAVWGPADCGKSTLINALVGDQLVPVAEGAVPPGSTVQVHHTCDARERGTVAPGRTTSRVYGTMPLNLFPEVGFGEDAYRWCEVKAVLEERLSTSKVGDGGHRLIEHKTSRRFEVPYVVRTCRCDVVWVCIDARKLGTPEEPTLTADFDVLRELDVASMPESVFYVITHADVVVDFVRDIHNIHRPRPDGYRPAFATIDELRAKAVTFVFETLGYRPKMPHVVAVGSATALAARRAQRWPSGDTRTSEYMMPHWYNFLEVYLGTAFMRSIDSMSVVDVETAARLNTKNAVVEYGYNDLAALIRHIDFNSGLLFVGSVLRQIAHVTSTFRDVMKGTATVVDAARQRCLDALQDLHAETAEIKVESEKVVAFALEANADMEGALSHATKEFWEQRTTELSWIMAMEPAYVFKSRQEGAHTDLSRALVKLLTFLDKYEHHREFMERKKAEGRSGEFEFVDSNVDGILESLENDRAKATLELSDAFVHHIHDEMVVAFPSVREYVQGQGKGLSESLRRLLEPAQARARPPPDVADLVSGWEGETTPYLQFDAVKLNNLMRAWPEHIAHAACTAANASDKRDGLDAEERIVRFLKCYERAWHDLVHGVELSQIYVYDAPTLSLWAVRCGEALQSYYDEYLRDVAQGIELQEDEIRECNQHAEEAVRHVDRTTGLLDEIRMLRRQASEGLLYDQTIMKETLDAEGLV